MHLGVYSLDVVKRFVDVKNVHMLLWCEVEIFQSALLLILSRMHDNAVVLLMSWKKVLMLLRCGVGVLKSALQLVLSRMHDIVVVLLTLFVL